MNRYNSKLTITRGIFILFCHLTFSSFILCTRLFFLIFQLINPGKEELLCGVLGGEALVITVLAGHFLALAGGNRLKVLNLRHHPESSYCCRQNFSSYRTGSNSYKNEFLIL